MSWLHHVPEQQTPHLYQRVHRNLCKIIGETYKKKKSTASHRIWQSARHYTYMVNPATFSHVEVLLKSTWNLCYDKAPNLDYTVWPLTKNYLINNMLIKPPTNLSKNNAGYIGFWWFFFCTMLCLKVCTSVEVTFQHRKHAQSQILNHTLFFG